MHGHRRIPAWLYDVLLIAVLLIGALLRFTGINWDADSFNHPDERFLVMTAENLSPVQNLAAYFDTSASTLNPNNRGASFYVYGTFPLVIVRYAVQWFGQNDLSSLKTIGRIASASMDLGTVFLAYLIAVRLYKRRTALLAAGFSALAVLQIQQSHFFTVDTFANFFIFLAIYFAIRIGTTPPELEDVPASGSAGAWGWFIHPSHPWFWPGILFGFSLGAAVACKVNAVPVTLMLPAAILVQLSRHPRPERNKLVPHAIIILVLAALTSLLVFRILQPYAFSGPGFLGVHLNPDWLTAITSQSAFASREVDYYPPAYQWARRPLWFSLQNLVIYGLGLPLGLLAWAGFLWAGWRMFKGEFRQHILLWGWTGAYFGWQSLAFNPTMRYQLPIYPSLVIFAGWAISTAWDAARAHQFHPVDQVMQITRRIPWKRILVAVVSVSVILATFAWALAFTQIYVQPLTRVAASRWLYQNLPGPITIRLQTATGPANQPLSIPYNQPIQAGTSYQTFFAPNTTGQLGEIYLAHAIPSGISTGGDRLHVSISSLPLGPVQPLGTASLSANLDSPQAVTFDLTQSVDVSSINTFYLNLIAPDTAAGLDLCAPVTLHFLGGSGETTQTLPAPADCMSKPGAPFSLSFQPQVDGALQQVSFTRVANLSPASESQSLLLLLTASPWQEQLLTTQALVAPLAAAGGADGYSFKLNPPAALTAQANYLVRVWFDGSSGLVTLQGTGLANEGAWDDPLPFRIDGYDAWNGIYAPDLNFDMYDGDDQVKLARIEKILDQSEYIAISSNRQYGSLTRLPERFPLTTLYYQDLLGCPPDKAIAWCYSVAQPGMFTGALGYTLVQVFESDPTLGPFHINDQFAEEAFTVYDHPKVLIFKKTADYSSANTRTLLSAVDFSKIVLVKPGKAGSFPANLLLPMGRWLQQMAGGTWSSIFNTDALQNKYPGIGLVLWYLAVMVLGLLVYPIVRLALPGLSDRGYPLARMVGLLLLALLVWLAGSNGVPFTRTTISLALVLLTVVGLVLAYRQRHELRREWQTKRRYFMMVEVVALVLFAIDLGIRLGNPDLWHPAYGGEKPMDFTIFNAVLKSTTFPPYDAWFAGGYLNYYYYGDVVVGVLVKWLGIVPSVAYNLVLPTLFCMLGLGAFSAGWNLSVPSRKSPTPDHPSPYPLPLTRLGVSIPLQVHPRGVGRASEAGLPKGEGTSDSFSLPLRYPVEDRERVGVREFASDENPSLLHSRQFWVAIAAAALMVILGNLGTVRMIWQGFQLLVVPSDTMLHADFFTRVGYSIQGFIKWVGGAHLPYSLGDWYWKPSRAIQPELGNEITEFPFFSFLYADLHASTMALPMAILAVGWALSVFLGRGRWGEPDGRHKWTSHGLGLLVGAVAIGALRPTNTWDIFTYLPLGAIALGYSAWCAAVEAGAQFYKRLARVAADVGLLVVLSIFLYQPFSTWFGQAYTQIDLWTGNHTVIWSYLVHWGLFLFIIFSWLVWETIDWMASTPLSSLAKLRPFFSLIGVGAGVWLALIGLLLLRGVQIAWVPLLLGVWAALLIFRPGMPDTKRAVLFLAGTALTLTLVVEVIVLHGDIGRQNTVFKLYLQAWTLFAVSSAAALGWLWQASQLVSRQSMVQAREEAAPTVSEEAGEQVSEQSSQPASLMWHPVLRVVWQVGLAALVGSAALCTFMMAANKIADRMTPSKPVTLDGMAFMLDSKYADGIPYSGNLVTMDLSLDYQAIRWMQENVQGSPVIVEANIPIYHWGSRFSIYTGLPGVLGWDWHEIQQRALVPSTWITERQTDIQQFYLTTDSSSAMAFLQKYHVTYIILGQYERLWYPGPGLDKFAAQNGILWTQVYANLGTVIYKVNQVSEVETNVP